MKADKSKSARFYLAVLGLSFCTQVYADQSLPEPIPSKSEERYTIGVNDVLDIAVLQPDKLSTRVTVAPDGTISFPFIGDVRIKGMTPSEVQEVIQQRLADGYMKYPVVAVSLFESRSRNFYVYGEVVQPGSYPLEANVTVLRAISIAGGFTKYGSSSRVKVLRPKQDGPGYETLKISMKDVMDGDSEKDIVLRPGDTVVVSEGIF